MLGTSDVQHERTGPATGVSLLRVLYLNTIHVVVATLHWVCGSLRVIGLRRVAVKGERGTFDLGVFAPNMHGCDFCAAALQPDVAVGCVGVVWCMQHKNQPEHRRATALVIRDLSLTQRCEGNRTVGNANFRIV